MTNCKAEEWQRDGRGLWAMRACINKAPHDRHVFERWRHNVKPPAADALREGTEPAALAAAEQQIADLTQKLKASDDWNLRAHRALNDANVPTETREAALSKPMYLVDRVEWLAQRLAVLEAREGSEKKQNAE